MYCLFFHVVRGWIFFENYSARFIFPGAQNILNWVFGTISTRHKNLMSILLDFFGFTVLLIIPSSMLLSVLTYVPSGGFMCLISIILFLVGNDYCAFIYNPLHSTSATDVITGFITLAKINIGPLNSYHLSCLNKNIQLL